jgi:hypothetical protein
VWWHTLVVPALARLRHENQEFVASLDYMYVCLKTKTCMGCSLAVEHLPGAPRSLGSIPSTALKSRQGCKLEGVRKKQNLCF